MFQIRHEPSSGCTQSENPRSDYCPESFFAGSPAATWTVRVSPLRFKVNTMPLQHYRAFMIVREIVITEIPVKSHGKAFGVPNVSRPVHLKNAERARFNFQDRVGAVSVQLGKSW